MFSSFWAMRSFRDWFVPLDGCPHCGYPYEPEPGYYFVAARVAGPGLGGGLGLILFLGCKFFLGWSNFWLLPFVAASVLVGGILFARHAKAFFLAGDFFLHFSEEEDEEGDGDQKLTPPPTSPAPPEKCRKRETAKN